MYMDTEKQVAFKEQSIIVVAERRTAVAAPGNNRGKVPHPETRKICKGWGTVHASASNENQY